MELLAALMGAIIGAGCSFLLSEYAKRKDERRKLTVALLTEVRMNFDLAEEIIRVNSKIDFEATGDKQWEWCEIIPFSEYAWIAVTSAGVLSLLDQELIEPLSRAFSMVKRANFAAEKMKFGRYHPREGKEYTSCVQRTRESLAAALDVLQGSDPSRKSAA